MNQVVIYTMAGCPYCIRAKGLFKELGVEYEEIDIYRQPEEYRQIQSQTHWDTVPQIFINKKFIGGCDDMMALHRQGELVKLLGLS